MGPFALLGGEAGTSMVKTAGAGTGATCTRSGPAGSIMSLAWPFLAEGSGALYPGEAVGPGAGSCFVAGSGVSVLADGIGLSTFSGGEVAGRAAAPLQSPSVSTS